jgi:S-(hydroxymethyl)mycothiol dehydrogenase
MPLIDVFGRGGSLKSSWYGDCLPSRDFPMLVDLYQQGRLDLDAFVTEEIGLDDVEAAFEKMHRGDVLRSVVVLVSAGVAGRESTTPSPPARSPWTARPSTSTTTCG